MTYASFLLTRDECGNLGKMLCKNKDILEWIHLDMLGIDLMMVFHKLNLLSIAQPIQYKVQRFHLDR